MQIKESDKEGRIWIPQTVQIFVFMEWCAQNRYDSFKCVYDYNIRTEQLLQSLLVSNMMFLIEFIISSEIS